MSSWNRSDDLTFVPGSDKAGDVVTIGAHFATVFRFPQFGDGPFPEPEDDFEKFLPRGIEPIAIPIPRQGRIVEK